MSVFAASSMSYCTFIAANANPAQSDGNSHDIEDVGAMHGGSAPSTYLISDKKPVCAVKFLTMPVHGVLRKSMLTGGEGREQPTVRGMVRPGDFLRVSLDFRAARQSSAMVRLRLLQKETHPDGTRLQVGADERNYVLHCNAIDSYERVPACGLMYLFVSMFTDSYRRRCWMSTCGSRSTPWNSRYLFVCPETFLLLLAVPLSR
jgi:hypothetical protein